VDPSFNQLVTDPWNEVFQVVFFPDRIYHAQYLNATRSARYRYNVREVRGKADINVLKGEVYLDGGKLCNFLRIEYRGARLSEVARERSRFLGPDVIARVTISDGATAGAQGEARMHFCPWINAFQVEFWETLEPPPGRRHDFQVLDLMGYRGSITRLPQFAPFLASLPSIQWVNLAFRENDVYYPAGFSVSEQQAAVDNYFSRNIQMPKTADPSAGANTVLESSYGVDFQRGWFVKKVRDDVQPVRYSNGMMMENNPDYVPGGNIIEMRWVLQQEFGGTVVFFHEVTIPPHTVEGTHQHIGSEELYYIIEGRGVAYMGEHDDPQLAANGDHPTVEREIYGIGRKRCKRVDVEPGSVIYTKSGGIHGIDNPYDTPLRFVAFLYHSA
jgi:mannose-6-phosphate isomerase-like protein (cupin superfamily)